MGGGPGGRGTWLWLPEAHLGLGVRQLGPRHVLQRPSPPSRSGLMAPPAAHELWARRKLRSSGLRAGSSVERQLRCQPQTPGPDTPRRANVAGERALPAPWPGAPGRSRQHGVGLTKVGLSVHPEVTFWALRAEEVTVPTASSLLWPCSPLRPGPCPHPFGSLCHQPLPATQMGTLLSSTLF